MKRIIVISICLIGLMIWGCTPEGKDDTNEVKFQIFESYHQIHILANGEHFTSYLYDSSLLKPVLFPLNSPSHILVERRYPLEMVEGESKDHPHHAGMFFTYGSDGEVNGNSFWALQKPGTRIRHIKVTRKELKENMAILGIQADWIGQEGDTLLVENRTMTFTGDNNSRAIDFIFNLHAPGEDVVFKDTKEGMFGMRVADWLTEDSGTGTYLNAEGDTTEANVWGKRSKWVRLEGTHDGKVIGIIIFNHPSSAQYPAYWHARGYGLFAANPLGRSVFEETRGKENAKPLNFKISRGDSALFRFMMIIYEGHRSLEQIENEFENYSS